MAINLTENLLLMSINIQYFLECVYLMDISTTLIYQDSCLLTVRAIIFKNFKTDAFTEFIWYQWSNSGDYF